MGQEKAKNWNILTKKDFSGDFSFNNSFALLNSNLSNYKLPSNPVDKVIASVITMDMLIGTFIAQKIQS